MANNLLIMNAAKQNILTDAALKGTDWDDDGIKLGETAWSNRLNALLRQITTVTHSVGDLLSDKLGKNIGSYNDAVNDVESATAALLERAIRKIVFNSESLTTIAEDKETVRVARSVWAGPVAGVKAKPTFRELVATDIPALDAAKITTGQFASARLGDLSVITRVLDDAAVTTNKIGNAQVTADKLAANSVTSVKILNANVTEEKLASNAVTTAKIQDAAVTAAKLATDSVTTAKIQDNAVTLDKLGSSIITGTGANRKILDALISPIHTSVVGRNAAGALDALTIVTLTRAQYDAIASKSTSTLYFIREQA